MQQLQLSDATQTPDAERRIDPDAWDGVLPPEGRPQIVVGGPGTGKTQFLAARVAAAVAGGVSPEHTLFVAFSRSGVADVRRRLGVLVGAAAHRVTVATHHALARRIVEAHAPDLGWGRPPTLLTSVEQERLVAELLADERQDHWPTPFRALLHTDVMAAELTDFILRSSEQRLDADAVASMGRGEWRAIPAFLRRYDRALRDRHRIDYGRLLMHAVAITEQQASIASRYRVVLADEYQDTSPVQAEFLLALSSSTPDLTVAADPYQSIYSFRGTNIDNVFSFPADTERALGKRAERLVLTTSFRVPSEILDAAVAVTARELPGGAGKVRSIRTSGSVTCHEFSTSGTEAEWVASDIERVHLVEGVPLERIAVFVRSHRVFVEELARALDRRQIAHGHVDDRLSDEPIVRFVHDLVLATGDGEDADAALRRVLLGPIVGLPNGLVAEMPTSRDERVAWVAGLPGCREISTLLDDTRWGDSIPIASGLWHLWTHLPHLIPVATDPERVHDRRAWSAFSQVVTRVGERSADATLAGYVASIEPIDFEADPLYDVGAGAGVTIGTLHRSKGTDYDVVYISDAVEGQLPDLRARDSILGVRHLDPHLPTGTADYVTFRLDEERRLAYTAMTRSTTRVVWTATVATESGGGQAPSRFMRLVAPTTRPVIDDRPLTPRSLIASLRRVVRDPLASPVQRIAALKVLTDRGLHAFDVLDGYGVRERGRDTGFVPDDVTLSPSQAVRYDACPRAYALERYVLTSIDESVHMRFGTLVHAVVEATESRAMEDGRARGTTEEALEELDLAWSDLGLGEDIVGEAWKARAARMLRDLYEYWPSNGTPVSLEVDLPLELGGFTWNGRADRVELVDGRLRIVDYKTGSAASIADAGMSLQLGYYILAARVAGDLASHDPVEEASFWHPKQLARGAVVTRDFDVANLDDVRERLIDIAEAIRGESFEPKVGSYCRTCPVVTVCPAQPIGVEAFIP